MKAWKMFLFFGVLFFGISCENGQKTPLAPREETREVTLRTFMEFQGEVQFADGTRFQSDTLKRVELPEHLWASLTSISELDSGFQKPSISWDKYYISWYDFGGYGYVAQWVENVNVDDYNEEWQQRAYAYVKSSLNVQDLGALVNRVKDEGQEDEASETDQDLDTDYVLWNVAPAQPLFSDPHVFDDGEIDRVTITVLHRWPGYYLPDVKDANTIIQGR